MSTISDNEKQTNSVWQRFYTWGEALDEALHHDPVAQLEMRVHDLNKRVQKINAAGGSDPAGPHGAG